MIVLQWHISTNKYIDNPTILQPALSNAHIWNGSSCPTNQNTTNLPLVGTLRIRKDAIDLYIVHVYHRKS